MYLPGAIVQLRQRHASAFYSEQSLLGQNRQTDMTYGTNMDNKEIVYTEAGS